MGCEMDLIAKRRACGCSAAGCGEGDEHRKHESAAKATTIKYEGVGVYQGGRVLALRLLCDCPYALP